jgi:hypothetical protein
MTRPHDSAVRNDEPAAAPSLADLFAQYLHRQTTAQAQGLGYPEPGDEVVPHDAVPVQPVDPQLAWHDALEAARLFQSSAGGWTVPPDWPLLVIAQEPGLALAFALGNFPQLVRNLHPLLSGAPLALRVAPGTPLAAPAVEDWAAGAGDHPQVLLAAGLLRLARHFDRAEDLLARPAPAAWHAAHANELAALAWHAGQGERALALWQAQEPSVPVLFNRGMAALFLDRPADAIPALTQAIAGLPETSAWHHLACLYLALAEVRA